MIPTMEEDKEYMLVTAQSDKLEEELEEEVDQTKDNLKEELIQKIVTINDEEGEEQNYIVHQTDQSKIMQQIKAFKLSDRYQDIIDEVSTIEKGVILQEDMSQMQSVVSSKGNSDPGHGNFLDLFSKARIIRMVGSALMMAAVYLGYSISQQINQKLGIENSFLAGILIGIAETAGYMVSFLLSNKLGRREINIICSSAYLLFGSILFIMDIIHKAQSKEPTPKSPLFNIIQVSKQ
jgi:hypothetical protein